jgi:hypothetical protein
MAKRKKPEDWKLKKAYSLGCNPERTQPVIRRDFAGCGMAFKMRPRLWRLHQNTGHARILTIVHSRDR